MKRSRDKPSDQVRARPTRQNICAVVVTYFPDLHFVERLDRIRSEVGKVIIVDNTSKQSPHAPPELVVPGDVEIVTNNENLGVGAALNQGILRAIQLGYQWVITFDQDSWVRPGIVEMLISIYDQQAKPELVGIIGCNFEDEHTHSAVVEYPAGGPSFRETRTVITSGSLLSALTFASVGPFRSDFFIDFIDHEYCLRLLQSGRKVLVSTAPLMRHALGHPTLISFDSRIGKLSVVLTNRSTLRRYYMTRNGIIVAFRYFLVAPMWSLRTLASLLGFAVAKIPWDGDFRGRKLCATIIGVFDAIRSKTGKATSRWLDT